MMELGAIRKLDDNDQACQKSDKDEILSFCINSFSWGDYINRVWDYWYTEKNGQLFVVESGGGRRLLCPMLLSVPKAKSSGLKV